MKKRNVIAITLIFLGVVFIIAAIIVVYSFDPLTHNNPVDEPLTNFFYNNRSKVFGGILYVISFLGKASVYIGILLLLYYLYDKKKTYRAMTLLVTSSVINISTKAAFNLDRPETSLQYGHNPEETLFSSTDEISSGIPSGHTQMSTTFLGSLMILIKKWWLVVVGSILAFLIGFSRIALREHWFTDVIMGLGIALIILAIYLFIKDPVENFIDSRTTFVKILLCITMFIVFAIPVIFLQYNRVKNDSELISESLKLITIFTTVSISYAIEGKLVNFHTDIDKWWKYFVRILIGAAFFAAFYFSLSELFGLIIINVGWNGIELTLDLIRYAILGPVVILLAPWVMMKLKI
ncbi:MAG: phosphatase PAP2 family protein [Candidatus Heimdallarchaeota archaeon]|nr:phosphatase PAP2 family protein [Candidatus Heimdallarchaeota archaeon]MCG3255959.1 phosphatase PAP2 family protein [Candidatus Heimdallarchaeota archaeon]MCK4611030.1 phosphatase PAP2 family protein [Candidatus Heimdallarchaeota archaeon]